MNVSVTSLKYYICCHNANSKLIELIDVNFMFAFVKNNHSLHSMFPLISFDVYCCLGMLWVHLPEACLAFSTYQLGKPAHVVSSWFAPSLIEVFVLELVPLAPPFSPLGFPIFSMFVSPSSSEKSGISRFPPYTEEAGMSLFASSSEESWIKFLGVLYPRFSLFLLSRAITKLSIFASSSKESRISLIAPLRNYK